LRRRFHIVLVRVGHEGMKVDLFFVLDVNHFKIGPARGHDMLVN
jgi:methanethiol oxidase